MRFSCAPADDPSIGRFLQTAPADNEATDLLQEPQCGAHRATRQHFSANSDPVILQIPVGGGKTGVVATLPFGIAEGRVLVITPNLTILKAVAAALDITLPNCFWRSRKVLESFATGPYRAILNGRNANIHDCVRSYFVVTNIQQLASSADRWRKCWHRGRRVGFGGVSRWPRSATGTSLRRVFAAVS